MSRLRGLTVSNGSKDRHGEYITVNIYTIESKFRWNQIFISFVRKDRNLLFGSSKKNHILQPDNKFNTCFLSECLSIQLYIK